MPDPKTWSTKDMNAFFTAHVGGTRIGDVAVNARKYLGLVVFYVPALPQDWAIDEEDARRLLACLRVELE